MDEQTTAQMPKSMSPMMIAGIVIIALLVIGGGFIAAKKLVHHQVQEAAMQMSATPTVGVTSMPTQSQASATATTAKEDDITVQGGSFYFKPTQITVKKGDSVKITFVNAGGFHDFVLDGYNVKTDIIGSGKSQTITFTADRAGTFAFYCSVGNHRAMGMAGTLTVE